MSNGQLSIEELYLRAGIKVGAPGESATAIPGTSNLQELPSMSDVASYLESGVFNITEEDLKGSKNDILNMFKSKLMPIGVDVDEAGTMGGIKLSKAGPRVPTKKAETKFPTGNYPGPSLRGPDNRATTIFDFENISEQLESINSWINTNIDVGYINVLKQNNPDALKEIYAVAQRAEVPLDEVSSNLRKEQDKIFENLNKKGVFYGKTFIDVFNNPEIKERYANIPNINYEEFEKWRNNDPLTPYNPEQLDQAQIRFSKDAQDTALSTYIGRLPSDKKREYEALSYYTANNFKISLDGLNKDIEVFKANMNLYDKNYAEFENNPTIENFGNLQAQHIALLEQQNYLQDKQLEVEKQADFLPVSLENLSKNYSRARQLHTNYKTVIVTIGRLAKDLIVDPADKFAAASLGGEAVTPFTMLKNKLGISDTRGQDRYEDILVEQETYAKIPKINEIKTAADAANWTVGTAAQTFPSLSVAFTGPAALPLFFSMGYGSKSLDFSVKEKAATERLNKNYSLVYDDNGDLLENNNLSSDEEARIMYEIEQDKKTLNINPLKKLTAQVLYGFSEMVFEKLGTIYLVNSIKKGIKGIAIDGLKDASKKIVKGTLVGKFREGASEVATQISQNAVDIGLLGEDKNMFAGFQFSELMDNTADVFAAGALMGVGMAQINNVKLAAVGVASELANRKEMKEAKGILQEMADLLGLENLDAPLSKVQINKLNKDPEVKKILNNLASEYSSIISAINSKAGKSISLNKVFELGEINRKIRKLNSTWRGQIINGNLSKTELLALKKSYKKEFDNLIDQRNSILENTVDQKQQLRLNQESKIGYDISELFYQKEMYNEIETTAENNFKNLNKTDLQQSYDNALAKLKKQGIKNPTQEQIKNEARKTYVDNVFEKKLDESIKNSENYLENNKELKKQVKEYRVAKTTKEAIAKYEEYLKKTRKYQGLRGKKQSDWLKNRVQKMEKNFNDGVTEGLHVPGVDGSYILIHKPNAIKNRRIGVFAHELLHAEIRRQFGFDPKAIEEAGKNLLDYIEKTQPELYEQVKERLDQDYAALEESDPAQYYEEAFTALSDVISEGKVKPKPSILEKIRQFLNLFLPQYFQLKTGQQAYEFVISFNAQAHGGGSAAMLAPTRIAPQVKEVKPEDIGIPKVGESRTVQAESKTMVNKAADSKRSVEINELYDKYKDTWNKKVWRNGKLVDEGAAGAISGADQAIIEMNIEGLISSWITRNNADALPGFSAVKEDISREVYASVFNEIRKFDGRGTFAGFSNQRIRFRFLDQFKKKGLFKKEFEKTISAPETKQIQDTQPEPEIDLSTEATQRTSILRKIIDLSEKQMNIVRNAVIKTILTGPKVLQTAKNKPRLFLDTLNKQLNTFVFKLVKNQLGTKSAYDSFIRLNAKNILEKYIPLSSIVAAKMDILYEPVIDPKTGKQARMTTVEANNAGIPLEKDGSGPLKWKRRKNVTNEQIIDFFAAKGINPKTGKPFGRATKGTRKDMISRMIAQRMGRDATSEIVQNREQPVYDEAGNETGRTINVFDMLADKNRNELQATEIVSQIADKLDVDPDIRFSKTGYNKLDKATKALRDKILSEYKNTPKALSNITQKGIANLPKDIRDLVNDIIEALPEYEKAVYRSSNNKKTIEARQKTNDLINKLGVDGYLNNIVHNAEIIRKDKIAWILGLDPSEISFKGGLKNNANAKRAHEEVIMPLFKKLGVVEAIKLLQAANASGIGRSIYGNNKTFFDEVIKKQEGVVIGKKGFDLKKIKYFNYKGEEKIGYTITNKGVKVTTDLVFEPVAFKSSLKSGESKINKKKREKLNDESGDRFMNLVDFLKEGLDSGDISTSSVGMMLRAQGSSMRTPLKMAAKLTKVLIDQNNRNYQNYRYEHLDPTDYLLRMASIYIVGGKGVTRDSLQNMVKNSEAALLPRSLTTVVDKYHKNSYDSKHTIKEGDNVSNRIFSIKTISELADLGYLEYMLVDAYQDGAYEGTNVNNAKEISKLEKIDEAIAESRKAKTDKKGISIFDLDDTLAKTKSNVIYTMPDGKKGKLSGEQFALKGRDLAEQGAEFDFSEFSKIVEGKKGPLFELAQKRKEKFGNKDIFILTARPHAAAKPIYEFLKSIGLEIPLSNIATLENSTAKAKADWVVSKAAEGYNDFYFADDVSANVKAVKKVLDIVDVKSDVQQVVVNESKSMNKEFNEILEKKTGIPWRKKYSAAKAKTIGATKGKFDFFISPSAEDFMGLIYKVLSPGKDGDAQMAWFKQKLVRPFTIAMNAVDKARVQMMTDYNALKKDLKNVPKTLAKEAIKGEGFTNEHAVRVYIWNKQGMNIPDISKGDIKMLVKHVKDNADLKQFADQLIAINKKDGYVKPQTNWVAGTITTDLLENINTVKRARYLKDSGWTKNVEIIFSEKNLNKLEAIYGRNYREALEDSLRRQKTGRNQKNISNNRVLKGITDWLNNSIGVIMFFNTRSAVLQLISSINFINWSDNNPIAAGKALANQKQFWKDFFDLMNSDYLVARRQGLKINVTEADIADLAETAGNSIKGAVRMLLKKGFTLTQIADSIAIASGGSLFYRNRVDSYKRQGLSQKEAEQQAYLDFREISEESQQSSNPMLISQQQASAVGRIILAFANTPSQYARLSKKAALDLYNGRGDAKTNISKLVYYMAVQNLIFNALQQALFALAFDDETPEEEKKKYADVGNGMLDSILRGMGYAGAGVSTIKNTMIRVYRENKKSRPNYADATLELLSFSPPIDAKISRLRRAALNMQYSKEGFGLNMESVEASALVISGLFNIPLDIVIRKYNNFSAAVNQENEVWQRIALALGWPEWQLGIDDKEIETEKKWINSNNTIKDNKKSSKDKARTWVK